ncbi:PD-(D/E)XK nuclease-like domain-containing protein [Chryseobacterium taichungense]|uniref:PD-(D/E)XK nuclease-like domain-containing protein n=1 Tax=Chryseobacterium taichungense TaxID=295069 RepID=UPI0028AA4F11|nr:PD-(D/E)XK nuclease-like domain-containing protein [Chryseobacterium taichungense]
MSLTGQLYEDFQSQNYDEQMPTPESNAKYDLIGKLINREIHLSYSKLKHLTSPVNFINALLEPKKKNSGMSFGSIVDCLLLTEEKFEEQFEIVENTPTTEKQEEFVNLVLDKMKMEVPTEELLNKKFKEAVSEGFSRVKTDGLEVYIMALLKGKECISKSDYDKAVIVVERLRNSDEISDELTIVDSFQKKLEFNYKGWNFICYLDTYFDGGFHDLKFASDCNPDKFSRDIEKFGYDIQFGIYAIGLEVLYGEINPTVKHITYDAVGNYGVYPIDSGYINYAKRKVDFLIACLDRTIEKRAFDKSYNFFRSQTTIYKPKWAAGFDMTIFENQ